jgi:hypothetical protein
MNTRTYEEEEKSYTAIQLVCQEAELLLEGADNKLTIAI